MTAKEIVSKYLQDNGFDGLANPGECNEGCILSDLLPCDSMTVYCEPAYRTKTPTDSRMDYGMVTEKPKDEKCSNHGEEWNSDGEMVCDCRGGK